MNTRRHAHQVVEENESSAQELYHGCHRLKHWGRQVLAVLHEGFVSAKYPKAGEFDTAAILVYGKGVMRDQSRSISVLKQIFENAKTPFSLWRLILLRKTRGIRICRCELLLPETPRHCIFFRRLMAPPHFQQ